MPMALLVSFPPSRTRRAFERCSGKSRPSEGEQIQLVAKHAFWGLQVLQNLWALEYNRACMKENVDYVNPFEPLHVSDGYQRKASFDIHPALYHVDFRTADENDYDDPHPVDDDAHFRWHRNTATKDNAGEDFKKRAYLGQHPLAARSFATATPISDMMLFSSVRGGSTVDIDLNRPITVFDVLAAIHSDLDTVLSMRDVRSYLLHGSHPHVKCVERAKWGVEEVFENLQTAREILTLCPIKMIEVDDFTDVGAAVFINLY